MAYRSNPQNPRPPNTRNRVEPEVLDALLRADETLPRPRRFEIRDTFAGGIHLGPATTGPVTSHLREAPATAS